jgi:recombination protein RecT
MSHPTTGTAVAIQEDRPAVAMKRVLTQMSDRFQALLPPNYPAERLIISALIAAQKEPKLYKCSQLSVTTALATIAQWGLEIGYTAHLLPFKADCVPVADYKGLIELMVAAGARKVEAREVREGDEFEYAFGSDNWLKHVPKAGSKAPIIAAWAVATLRGGTTQIEVMSADEIDEIRKKRSKEWKDGELTYWYARKTVIRRLAKYLPRNPRLQAAVEKDEIPASELTLPSEEEASQVLMAAPPTGRLRNPRSVQDGGYADQDGVVQERPPVEVMERPTAPPATTMFEGQPDFYAQDPGPQQREPGED